MDNKDVKVNVYYVDGTEEVFFCEEVETHATHVIIILDSNNHNYITIPYTSIKKIVESDV